MPSDKELLALYDSMVTTPQKAAPSDTAPSPTPSAPKASPSSALTDADLLKLADANLKPTPVVAQASSTPAQPEESDTEQTAEDFLTGILPKQVYAGTQAGSEAALNFIYGDKGPAFVDQYRKYLDQAKQAQARSPIAYGAGGVLGAVPLGAAAPAGLAGAALVGGALGATSSPEDITTEEGAKSALEGGAIGSAFGAGTSAALSGLGSLVGKSISNATENYPSLRRLAASFSAGTEGQGFTGEANRELIRGQLRQSAEDVADQMVGAREAASENIGGMLEQAPPINPDSINARMGTSYDPTYNPPPSASDLFSQKQDLWKDYWATQDPNEQNTILNKINGIEGTLSDNVPDYQATKDALKNFSDQAPEQFLNKQLNQYKNSDQAKEALADKLFKMSQMSAKAGTSARHEVAEDAFNTAADNLENMKENTPDVLNNLGVGDLNSSIDDLRQKADLEEVRQQIERSGSIGLLSPKLWVHQVADMAGLGGLVGPGAEGERLLVANQLGKVSSPVASFGARIMNAPNTTIAAFASAIGDMGFNSDGAAITKALVNKDQQGLNAALFSAVQKPGVRALFQGSGQENQ
jgi:hypothetical protein